MISSKDELFEVLEKISSIPITVIGDLILDRYIWGTVERISPEAPVPVVLVKRGEDRLGGAGNVVRNLCSIGAKVSVCGFIGDDEEGRVLLGLLDKEGVEKDGVMIDRARPTPLKTRVIAASQQVVRIDRENTAQAPALGLIEGIAAHLDAKLDTSKAIIVSDYGKGTISESLMRRLSEARQAGRLGLGKRPLVVDPHPANYDIYRCISVAKPNRKEAEKASGVKIVSQESAIEAAKVLLKRWDAEMMIITLGEGGLVIVSASDAQGIALETVARTVFDVSGAGDTVTAVFTAALAVGATPQLAGELANIAAGAVVSEVGTVAINLEKLKSEIERLDEQAGKSARREEKGRNGR